MYLFVITRISVGAVDPIKGRYYWKTRSREGWAHSFDEAFAAVSAEIIGEVDQWIKKLIQHVGS